MKKLYITLTATMLASAGFAQTVFDAITGGTAQGYTVAGVYENQQAEDVTLSLSNMTLNKLDFEMVNNLTASYSDVQVVVQFFSSYQDTNTGSTPEFSGLLSTTQIDLGALSVTASSVNLFLGLGLTPTAVSGNKVGVMLTLLSSVSGAPLGPATHLETGLNLTTAPTIGSNSDATNWTWGRANGTSSTVPTGSQVVTFGGFPTSNENLDIRLFGTPAPEPVSLGLLGFGVVGLLARRRNRS